MVDVEPLYFFIMITKHCTNCNNEKPIYAFMKQNRSEVLLDKCWDCNSNIIKQGEFWSKSYADSVPGL